MHGFKWSIISARIVQGLQSLRELLRMGLEGPEAAEIELLPVLREYGFNSQACAAAERETAWMAFLAVALRNGATATAVAVAAATERCPQVGAGGALCAHQLCR